MRTLRFYWIERDGHIHRPPQEIECEDDADARRRACDMVKDGEPGRSIEIWDRARCLGKFVVSADQTNDAAKPYQQRMSGLPKGSQSLKFGLAPRLRYALQKAA